MHVFDGKNWISFFLNSLFSGIVPRTWEDEDEERRGPAKQRDDAAHVGYEERGEEDTQKEHDGGGVAYPGRRPQRRLVDPAPQAPRPEPVLAHDSANQIV